MRLSFYLTTFALTYTVLFLFLAHSLLSLRGYPFLIYAKRKLQKAERVEAGEELEPALVLRPVCEEVGSKEPS